MTKAELITAVAEKANLSKASADAALNAVVDTIVESLANGEKVTLTGFGTFEPKERKERVCINPKTLEKISVKATVVPSFKAGKSFKDSVSK